MNSVPLFLGILVVSDQDVLVQCINTKTNTADAFHVPPVSQLGYVHVAMMYKYTGSSRHQGPYEIAIVASHLCTTTIQLFLHGPATLSVNFGGASYTNGDIVTIILQQYETAQVTMAIKVAVFILTTAILFLLTWTCNFITVFPGTSCLTHQMHPRYRMLQFMY